MQGQGDEGEGGEFEYPEFGGKVKEEAMVKDTEQRAKRLRETPELYTPFPAYEPVQQWLHKFTTLALRYPCLLILGARFKEINIFKTWGAGARAPGLRTPAPPDVEDVDLDEFIDEIEGWVLDELKAIGCDTAKSILDISEEELVKRTDLEEETITEVLKVLRSEFE